MSIPDKRHTCITAVKASSPSVHVCAYGPDGPLLFSEPYHCPPLWAPQCTYAEGTFFSSTHHDVRHDETDSAIIVGDVTLSTVPSFSTVTQPGIIPTLPVDVHIPTCQTMSVHMGPGRDCRTPAWLAMSPWYRRSADGQPHADGPGCCDALGIGTMAGDGKGYSSDDIRSPAGHSTAPTVRRPSGQCSGRSF